MSKKVAVLLFPGSNCELEAIRACERSGLKADLFRWNDDAKKLHSFDAYIIPGGFSYEDRGRSGVIASKDPIMAIIKKEADNGKPVLGLCNGAQILVETGLVPGVKDHHLDLALTWNVRMQQKKILGVGYYNDWVYIRHNMKPGRSVFNRFSPKTIMRIPVAHGEGRFTTQENKLLETLVKNEQTLFRYCDVQGRFNSEFPTNTNGAIYNLAGVCNPQGNVLALMPHPERAPISGQPIFDSLADTLQNSKKIIFSKQKKSPLQKNSSEIAKKTVFEKNSPQPDITILIKLIITDNEERTIEKTLHTIGYPEMKLQRQIFLSFNLKDKKDLKKTAEKLIKSGEILNLNKEIPTIFIDKKVYRFDSQNGLEEIKNPLPPDFNFFVTEYENYTGKSIQANLAQHLGENQIQKVERGIFWTIQTQKPKDIENMIQTTYLFHNPHSMKIKKF